MAEWPRRPSFELGSDPSSPTPPKKPKKSEDPEESSAKPVSGQTTSSEIVATISSSLETSKEEPGTPKSRLETEEQTTLLPFSEKSKSPTQESPVASTSRKTEEEAVPVSHPSPLPPPEVLPPSSDATTSTGSMEIVARGGLAIQASLVREHSQYQELSLIGNGAYGTVYKAKEISSGQVVALKKVRVPITGDGLPSSTLREIAALKQLDRYEHPHIVRLLDVCQGPYLTLPPGDERPEAPGRGLMLWLVFEHVERDLASFMTSCPPPGIPGDTIKKMSREILLGVDFLHSHRIVHRDLKPQNLLVTSQGRIKIADFGLAKTYDFEMRLTTVVVTLWYRAPEVLLGCAYATPVDIWSVGCILAELCRLEPLFPGTSEGDQLDRIFKVIGTPPQQEWPEDVSLGWTAFPHRQPAPLRSIIPDLPDSGLDLIQRILRFDPHSRLTAAQALSHRYFTEDHS